MLVVRGVRGGCYEVNVTVVIEQEHQENWGKHPSWRAKCRSGFATLPPVLLQQQHAMVFSLERALGHSSSSYGESTMDTVVYVVWAAEV
jgi:hypothetical protein